MSNQLLVSTRKGLFHLRREGGWSIRKVHFLGDNVSLCLADPRDGAWYAALDHGHFGVKLQRSRDEGATWEEVRPGSTSDPPSVRIQDGIRYYPPTGKTSSHGWLDLKYVVKPSSWQVGIGEWALILIGAVAGLLSAMLGVGRDNEGESAKLKGAMFVTGGIYLFASAAWTWVSISLVGRGWNDTLLKWAEPTGVLVAAIVLRLVIDRKHGK